MILCSNIPIGKILAIDAMALLKARLISLIPLFGKAEELSLGIAGRTVHRVGSCPVGKQGFLRKLTALTLAASRSSQFCRLTAPSTGEPGQAIDRLKSRCVTLRTALPKFVD